MAAQAPEPHHGEVVAVDEAHVVVVRGSLAERELGEGGRRRGSGAVAVNLAGPAVAGGARGVAGVVEFAAGSAPEPPRPTRRRVEATRASSLELETGCSDVRFS